MKGKRIAAIAVSGALLCGAAGMLTGCGKKGS